MIAFDSGHAFPGILPDMTAAAELALTRYRSEALQYGPRPGLPEMREWVASYLNADGARVAMQNVLMTNGAKHAIELICRLVLEEGDCVVVTAPTYYTAIPLFRCCGASFIEVGQDEHGMRVAEIADVLEARQRSGDKLPKLIYNVPDFHNPTGVTMSRARREALLELAARYGIAVVEDSPYRQIRFEGQTEPSLKALDEAGTVLNVGTFSKLLAPGLRVGWVIAPSDAVQRLALLKPDGGSSPLVQRTVLEFCKRGGVEEHTILARRTYAEHRDRMVQALQRHLPDAAFAVPEGGYYLWLTLPPHVDGDAVARAGAEEGVSIYPGSKFYANPGSGDRSAPRNNLRLNYSHATLDEIDEGVRRVAKAYARVAAESADTREKAWLAPSA